MKAYRSVSNLSKKVHSRLILNLVYSLKPEDFLELAPESLRVWTLSFLGRRLSSKQKVWTCVGPCTQGVRELRKPIVSEMRILTCSLVETSGLS